MNKAELIELLEEYDDNTEVFFTYDYGDHWRTQVAASVERVEEGDVRFSDYHRMHAVAEDDKDYGVELKKGVILLR